MVDGAPMTISERMEQRRRTIEEAGYAYPLAWNEMGSSAKDLWEEKKLREIAELRAKQK